MDMHETIQLTDLGLRPEEAETAGDGFCAVKLSVAEILARQGIRELPGDTQPPLPCGLYYDDWHPYSLSGGVWGLCKLREQEYDGGDSDDPGVTISFIAFDAKVLRQSLLDPSEENLLRLRRELHRVTAQRGQRHHPALKAYFLDPKSQGSYLIARLYIRKLADCAGPGPLPLPRNCRALLGTPGGRRLRRFLEENDRKAGKRIFTGESLLLSRWEALTEQEQLALLAVHTGNTSLHSFAAEVCFHAAFLFGPAGSPLYASAVRADMAVRPREFGLVCPYYDHRSRWCVLQRKHHPQV